MTPRCSCLVEQPGTGMVRDPECKLHGDNASPMWAKIAATIIVLLVVLILLGVLIHTARWALR